MMPFVLHSQIDSVDIKRSDQWLRLSMGDYNKLELIEAQRNVWLDVLGNGLGFAKNITDKKDYTPIDDAKLVGKIINTFKKENKLCAKGKLKPHQCNRIDMMLMSIQVQHKKQ